jgi:hypothetical protein
LEAILETETQETTTDQPFTTTDKPPAKEAKQRQPKAKHFPRPPKFDCNPDQFFKYWQNLPQECLDRCAVYVYATWPVLDHLQVLSPADRELIRLKKRAKPVTNIAKPDRPFDSDDWEMEILHRWGSGNYHFKLNDVGAKGFSELVPKSICMCNVTRLENPEYPPVRDIRIIDMSHPDNQSYIAKLRMQGVRFPGDEIESTIQKEDDEMANIAAVEKLADTVVQMTRDNQADRNRTAPAAAAPDVQGLAGAKAVESVAEGAKQGMAIISEAVKTANEMQAKAQDPRQYIKDMHEMVSMMQPATQKESGGDSAILAMMKMQHETHMAEMRAMNERLAASEMRSQTLVDKLISKPADEPSKRPRGLVEELKALNDIKDTLREFIGDGDGGAGDIPWWGGAIMKGLEVLPGAVTNFMSNLAVARTGQGQPVPPVETEVEDDEPAQIEPAKPTGPDAMIIDVLSKLKDPIVQALANGTPGSDFAAALIHESKNEQLYKFLSAQGKAGLFTIMMKHPDLWRETRPYSQRLEKFADEFLDSEKVKQTLEIGRAAQPKPNGAPGRVIIDPITGQGVKTEGTKINRPPAA